VLDVVEAGDGLTLRGFHPAHAVPILLQEVVFALRLVGPFRARRLGFGRVGRGRRWGLGCAGGRHACRRRVAWRGRNVGFGICDRRTGRFGKCSFDGLIRVIGQRVVNRSGVVEAVRRHEWVRDRIAIRVVRFIHIEPDIG
jgi:hypothetical protein